ncbi:MAG: superoxide dismutase family protein [Thermomicrobiales bacterium]
MNTVFRSVAVLVLAGFSALGAAAAQQDEPQAPPASLSISDLNDSEGNLLGYAMTFLDDDGVAGVAVVARGLAPGSHGVHVHETGNCDPAGEKTFEQAGAHFNPGHGTHPTHAGDLGNLIADENGETIFTAFATTFDLSDAGPTLRDADGSALVIHADVDDLATDPSGNSGARIACAVLFPAQ